MPQDMDYALYFNLMFAVIVIIAMLFGFLRGMKKSIFAFIVNLAFVVIFFATINIVVNQLWTMSLPLGDVLGGIDPALAGVSTLKDALPMLLGSMVGDDFAAAMSNQELINFLTGLSLFILKIVWTILYFTVIAIIYRFIFFLIRWIFVKAPNKTMTSRSIGTAIGALNGLLTVYVTIIVLGGLMSISESVLILTAHQRPDYQVQIEETEDQAFYLMTTEFIAPMQTQTPAPGELDEMIGLIDDFVSAFNANYFVRAANQVTTEDAKTGADITLHHYLFDSVMSFEYRDKTIAFRKELSVFAEVAGLVLNSDYMETNDLSDLTGDEIRAAFNTLSESDLFTSLIPLAIDVAADMYDMDIEIPRDDLYVINWETEVQQLGTIAAVVFDLVNAAGIMDGEADLETVTLDGDDVKDLFVSLSDSELVTLAAYVAIEPLLEMAGGQVQAIITVPADLDWQEEFLAIGEIAKAVLDTDITVGTLQSGEPFDMIASLAQLDFKVLLDSKIVTYGLINILDGSAGIEGLDMIVVEDDIVWLDEYDEFDNLVQAGELRNVLEAVNTIAQIAQTIDFNNLDLNTILNVTMADIDSILESKLLSQTFGYMLMELVEEQDMLVIPRLVIEEITVKSQVREIVTKPEIRALFAAVFALEFDDLEALDFEPAILKRLADPADATKLDNDKKDDLFGSHILHATLSNFMFDMMNGENQILTVPYVDENNEPIRHYKDVDGLTVADPVTGHDTEYVSIDEFTALLEAIMIIDLDNFDDLGALDMDNIIDNFDALLESAILHATISNILIDNAEDNDMIVVPLFDDDGNEIRKNVGPTGKQTEYVLSHELESIFDALKTLEISLDDFEGDFSFDLEKLQEDNDDITPVLDSAILHATISQLMLNLEEDDTIILPEKGYIGDTLDERDIKKTTTKVVDLVEHSYEFVHKAEIQAIINGLIVIGVTDFDDFDGSFDLGEIMKDDNRQVLLKSAVVHATITRTLIDLGSDVIIIPEKDADDVDVFGDLIAYSTIINEGTVDEETVDQKYIIKDEIYALIDVLDMLGLADEKLDDEFSFDLKLDNIFGENKTILLSSASIHATVTKQLVELGEDVLIIPEKDANNDDVFETVQFTYIKDTVDVDQAYITKAEIEALIDVLEILGLGDSSLDNFNIDIKIDVLFDDDTILDPNEQPKVRMMNSASIHATMTKQLIELGEDILVIPDKDAENNDVFESVQFSYSKDDGGVPVTVDQAFITKNEIYAMIDVLEILGLGNSSLDNFDINIKISVLFDDETILDPNEQPKVKMLNSASIHATMTKQLVELGDDILIIPDRDSTDDRVRAYDDTTTSYIIAFNDGVDDHAYIIKDEIYALIDVLEILELGESSLNNFDVNIQVNVLFDKDGIDFEDQPKVKMLNSASIHATITKQLIDLRDTNQLVVPEVDQDGTTIRSMAIAYVDVGSVDRRYIIKDEIYALIDVLEILQLGTSSLDNFNVDIKLNYFFMDDLIVNDEDQNQYKLLQSASIHATITKQLIDLGTAIMVIPEIDHQNIAVRTNYTAYTDDLLQDRRYIIREEIRALIDAMEVLGLGDEDLGNFRGEINLSNLYGNETNQDKLLSSASIHATITRQMEDIKTNGHLIIPTKDISDTALRTAFAAYIIDEGGPGEEDILYIIKDEIKGLIDALEVLGVEDITTFEAQFTLALLQLEANQDALLSSASIHATISDKMLGLDDGVLIVPIKAENNTTLIRSIVEETEFIVRDEIKAIINAFNALEDPVTGQPYENLDSFGANLDSGQFFDQKDTLLLSVSIHATLSDKLLKDAGDELVIPDVNVNTSDPIRRLIDGRPSEGDFVAIAAFVFVDRDEIHAILDALDELGLRDFETINLATDFTPATIFNVNFDTLLASASIQATISKNVLADALDETASSGTTLLIVPTGLREAIHVETIAAEHIEKAELKKLLTALKVLDIAAFDGNMNASVITNLTRTDLEESILVSGSLHVTLDNMLRGNANIIQNDLANDDYNFVRADALDYNMTTDDEIINFIVAAQILATGDFTDVSFDITAIRTLPTAKQENVLTAMLVRSTLTPDIELAVTFDPGYTLENSDYMNNDPSTDMLTKQGIFDYIAYLESL